MLWENEYEEEMKRCFGLVMTICTFKLFDKSHVNQEQSKGYRLSFKNYLPLKIKSSHPEIEI